MINDKKGLFLMPDGKYLVVTFTLVSSLFLLWGFCNGMIDVMDKHFQQELHLTLAQSAWVQFAHYLGYFLMALPAGWLATKIGYKGGIIVGLLIVAVGGFWFIPATNIAAFWAFLLGVCFIAAGLTFLETVANPYTTVLGPPEYAAFRINLAQFCNGVGWIFGPIAGGMFFYGKDAVRWTPKIGQEGSLSPNPRENDPHVQKTPSASSRVQSQSRPRSLEGHRAGACDCREAPDSPRAGDPMEKGTRRAAA